MILPARGHEFKPIFATTKVHQKLQVALHFFLLFSSQVENLDIYLLQETQCKMKEKIINIQSKKM